MTAEQFAYWMQGFAELNDAPPTKAQWKAIREHLATVFTKITPAYLPDTPNIIPVGMRKWVSPTATPNNPPLRAECIARPVAGGDGNTYAIC